MSSWSHSTCPKLYPTSLTCKANNTDQDTKKTQVILLLPLKFCSSMYSSKEIRRERSIDVREKFDRNSEENSQRGISFIECDILNFSDKSPASKGKKMCTKEF